MYQIIKKPLITEKAEEMKPTQNKVTFKVQKDAEKSDIRKAVEDFFGVGVVAVNTMVYRGKTKRVGRQAGKRSNWKKAIVTLKKGTDLDIFGGPDMPTADVKEA